MLPYLHRKLCWRIFLRSYSVMNCWRYIKCACVSTQEFLSWYLDCGYVSRVADFCINFTSQSSLYYSQIIQNTHLAFVPDCTSSTSLFIIRYLYCISLQGLITSSFRHTKHDMCTSIVEYWIRNTVLIHLSHVAFLRRAFIVIVSRMNVNQSIFWIKQLCRSNNLLLNSRNRVGGLLVTCRSVSPRRT